MPRDWQCNCPICRVLVKRVINRVTSNMPMPNTVNIQVSENREEVPRENQNTLTIEELKQRFPVENIKIMQEQVQQTTQPASRQNSQAGEEEKEERKENEEKAQVQVEIPKEFVDRIEHLESEVSNIKKYVKTAIDGIKAVLVDLRSTMTELSNPFNILRKYADIFFGGEEGQILINKSVSQIVQNQSQVFTQKIPPPQTSPGYVHPICVQKKSAHEELRDQEKKVEGKRKSMDLNTYSKLAEWVDLVLKRIPPDKLNEIIDNYVEVGIIGKDLGEALKKIVKIVEELKRHGVSVEEQRKVLSKLIENLSQNAALTGRRSDLLDLIEGD